MNGHDARRQLRDLLAEKAVEHGDFLLSSGARSRYYLDARLVTLSSRGAALVGQVLFELLRGHVQAPAGPSVAADPIVTAIAVVSGERGEPIDALIVRKEAKQHGRRRRIEGPWRDGLVVAVLDDTLTSGASLLDAVHAVSEAGGIIQGVYALIDREEGGGRRAIQDAGYPFHAVFTAREIVSPA